MPALRRGRSGAPGVFGRPLRRFVAGLGLIGALALIFWVVESRTGWNGLDGEHPRRGGGTLLRRSFTRRDEAGHDPV